MSQDTKIGARHGKIDKFKTVKGDWQRSILSLCLCESNAEYTIKIPGDWIRGCNKVVWRNINNLTYVDGNIENTRKWRINKEPLDEDEWEEWKRYWKLNIHKNKDKGIWSHHYSANRTDKHVQTVTGWIFFGSTITKNGECSHQVKCHLLLDVKAMDKPRHCIKKKTHHLTKFSVNKNSQLW